LGASFRLKKHQIDNGLNKVDAQVYSPKIMPFAKFAACSEKMYRDD
jgi:hypothetical protein